MVVMGQLFTPGMVQTASLLVPTSEASAGSLGSGQEASGGCSVAGPAVSAGCRVEASLRLSATTSTRDLSMWLWLPHKRVVMSPEQLFLGRKSTS